MLRVRVTQSQADDIASLAKQLGKDESEIVRDALRIGIPRVQAMWARELEVERENVKNPAPRQSSTPGGAHSFAADAPAPYGDKKKRANEK